VNVTQPELRGRTFEGEIARTSASIDTTTRTMQVEVTLPNREGALLPGAYVQLLLPLAASKSLSVPVNALMIRGDGISVAVVAPDGRVHLQPVHVGRNYGEAIEVLDGLSGTERLVLNPSDSLAEGDHVVVAAPDAARGKRAEASK